MTYSPEYQNQLKEALLNIDHLKHENYILLEQLKSKDSIFKLLIAELDIIFGAISSDKTIKYIVGKGLDIFNINAVDVLGRNFHDAISKIPELIAFLETCLEGKPLKEEIFLDESLCYQFSSQPVIDEDGKLLHVFVLAIPI